DQKSSLSYFKFPKLENWKWYINTERLIFSCQLLCPIQLARDGIWGFIIFIGDKPLIIATTGENTKIRDKHYDVVNIYLNETSLDTQQCFDLIQEMYPNFYLS
ncbi:hypothetical protein, partial [Acinetobacter piscicola]|uniref:hypothetical protein n=1 Tax=Acinetobacter piscicola TaxID=2006115 RepID=UPI0012FF97DA